jgi:IS5 family transposase
LAAALQRSDGSKGGRPPYDPVLMLEALVLQTLYTLSDDATEFQIRDRLSFMRFLGLGLEGPVPDAKTIWLFREQLTRTGAIEGLFARFDAWLKAKGYLAMSGQIVDASIIAAPRQRNTEAEKAALKEGRVPEGWKDKPAKLAQKDRDARWTLKRAKARKAKADGSKAKVEIAIPVFGYKNHVSIDRAHGFVRKFTVTSAAAHDGAQLGAVLDKTNTASSASAGQGQPPFETDDRLCRSWADTAYRSKENEAHLERNGFRSKIHVRRQRGLDLTASQRKANRARSKVRSAVETVFAAEKHIFGLFVRSIGIARATTRIGLANLVYNVRRYLWIDGRAAPA